MNVTVLRGRLLTSTMIAGVLAAAGPAFAQNAGQTNDPAAAGATQPATQPAPVARTAASTNASEGDTIVVTGSRIPQPNLTGASPITVVNSAEIKAQGITKTEDLINNLPQAFAAQGSQISNGSTGTATVDLRGLGSARTLVLVDGRRLLPGDPRSPVADINFIPASIIKKVEVLTGGASSVYGADAVSGVVNFVMDTDFEGIRADVQYSLYNHDNRAGNDVNAPLAARGFSNPKGNVADGGTIDASLSIGAGFDDNRGHVTAYATYRQSKPILQANRDYSACSLATNTPAQIATRGRQLNCGGSATSANGTFFTNDGTFQVGPNSTFIPGSTPYNFAPTNYYTRPDERYTFGVFANYEISPAIKPYLEAMFMDDRSVAQIAASGDFGNTTTINSDNPLLSDQQRATIFTPTNTILDANGNPQVFTDALGNRYTKANLQPLRRNVEGGGRRDDLQHTDYRIVVGAKGDIAKGLSYDAYYQYGRVNFAQTYRNDFSVTRLTRALDVVAGPNGPVCRSTLDGTDANCVPYNIFTLNSVNPAALQYLQTPGFSRGQTEESVANGSLTFLGEEYGLQSPWAKSGIAINVGGEWRRERLNFESDLEFSTGDLAGQGGPTLPVAGSFTVKEGFTEVRIPLVSDKPFFEDLYFDGAYRYSSYHIPGTATSNSNSFSTNTYKLEAGWAPIRDLRFRASYNRAVRAPNVVDLFTPASVGLDGATDPCAGAAPTATQAQCVFAGVPANRYGTIVANPANQYNGLTGGNTGLLPEKATTKTFGVVLQPSFLPGFSATIDYFDIKVKNAISAGIGADTILDQCTKTGQALFCNLIHRDANFSIWRSPQGFVVDTNLNIGGVSTKGIDLNVNYSHEFRGIGTFSASLIGTWLDKLVTDTGVGVVYDCAGFYGTQCGTPNPEWRHKARFTFTLPSGPGISLGWRYFSSVKLDKTSDDPDLRQANQATLPPYSLKVPSQSYFDLSATIPVGDKFTFRVGADNIADKSPPIIGSNVLTPVFGNGNTFPQVYDALGRYIYAGVTLNF